MDFPLQCFIIVTHFVLSFHSILYFHSFCVFFLYLFLRLFFFFFFLFFSLVVVFGWWCCCFFILYWEVVMRWCSIVICSTIDVFHLLSIFNWIRCCFFVLLSHCVWFGLLFYFIYFFFVRNIKSTVPKNTKKKCAQVHIIHWRARFQYINHW